MSRDTSASASPAAPDTADPMAGMPAIYSALDFLNRETGALGKTQRSEQGYMFRGIDALYEHFHPKLAEVRVITVPGKILQVVTEQRARASGAPINYAMIRREYQFLSLEDGSEIIVEGIGEALDTSDKAMNKAQSNAHKYAFFQLFTIPTNEPEADHEHHEAAAPYRSGFNGQQGPDGRRWDAHDPDSWGAAYGQQQPQQQWGPAPDAAPRRQQPQQRPPQSNGNGQQQPPQRPQAPQGQQQGPPPLNLDNLQADLMNATTEDQVMQYHRALIANMKAQRIDNQSGARAMKLIKARRADFAEE